LPPLSSPLVEFVRQKEGFEVKLNVQFFSCDVGLYACCQSFEQGSAIRSNELNKMSFIFIW
jgi:hypothetical protein